MLTLKISTMNSSSAKEWCGQWWVSSPEGALLVGTCSLTDTFSTVKLPGSNVISWIEFLVMNWWGYHELDLTFPAVPAPWLLGVLLTKDDLRHIFGETEENWKGHNRVNCCITTYLLITVLGRNLSSHVKHVLYAVSPGSKCFLCASSLTISVHCMAASDLASISVWPWTHATPFP